MNAIILSIGDELVLGQTVDTNSAWISQHLAAIGCPVRAHVTVGDDQPAIENAIRHGAATCDLLIISGGIGPTPDDLTRQALAAVMGAPLELNTQWLEHLHAFFARRNRPMAAINRIQAMIPRGAEMIFNTAGTASGISAMLPRAEREPCRVFVVPGVPKEMKIMFADVILPVAGKGGGGGVILSRTLHTFGLGESAVAEMLGELMRRDRNPQVGTTVSDGIVSIRVNSRFAHSDEAQRRLDETVAACRAAMGNVLFGEEDQTLPQAVAGLLKSAGGTVATAESCTGGLLAKMLTDVPGSSSYFTQGWITYSNEAKSSLLGVSPELIAQHGAVSEPVASAMASGALTRARARHALAITGIAGPDGGTAEKPVGMVCIALAHDAGVLSRTYQMPGDREMIRDRSAKTALALLRYHLLGEKAPW